MNILAKDIKVAFSYNPETGVLTNKISRGPRAKIGMRAGYKKKGYLYVTFRGRSFSVHRMAYAIMNGEFPSEEVDHINGIKSDNRWENLRLVNRKQQCANKKHGGNRTGYKGVGVNRSGTCYAIIRDDGIFVYLGTFVTAEIAARRYDLEAIKRFGVYARTNFPKIDYDGVSLS